MPRANPPASGEESDRREVDLLYDTLLALMMKLRRVQLGKSLDRRDHPGRQTARLVSIARAFQVEDLSAVWDGFAPPRKPLDDDIPF